MKFKGKVGLIRAENRRFSALIWVKMEDIGQEFRKYLREVVHD